MLNLQEVVSEEGSDGQGARNRRCRVVSTDAKSKTVQQEILKQRSKSGGSNRIGGVAAIYTSAGAVITPIDICKLVCKQNGRYKND